MNKRADFITDLEHSAFWMPFTANRQFKKAPRLLARAEGMYYWTPDGRQLLDGCAGLWCVNAGHCRPKIVEAIKRQAGEMDFAPIFRTLLAQQRQGHYGDTIAVEPFDYVPDGPGCAARSIGYLRGVLEGVRANG